MSASQATRPPLVAPKLLVAVIYAGTALTQQERLEAVKVMSVARGHFATLAEVRSTSQGRRSARKWFERADRMLARLLAGDEAA